MTPDMEPNLQPLIDRALAELRLAHARITTCHGALQVLRDRGRERYSMWLDIRWPDHQSIVSGPERETAAQAVQAALEKARAMLGSSDT